MKQLLALEIWRFTGEEIGKLKAAYPSRDWVYHHMPKYCLTDKGLVGETQQWLQFIESGQEKYWLFDIPYVEGLLSEEINNSGIEGLFEGTDWRPMFEYFQGEYGDTLGKPVAVRATNNYEWYGRTIPLTNYAVIDLEYYGNDEDCELEVRVYGYMDGLMKSHLYSDLCNRHFILNTNPDKL